MSPNKCLISSCFLLSVLPNPRNKHKTKYCGNPESSPTPSHTTHTHPIPQEICRAFHFYPSLPGQAAIFCNCFLTGLASMFVSEPCKNQGVLFKIKIRSYHFSTLHLPMKKFYHSNRPSSLLRTCLPHVLSALLRLALLFRAFAAHRVLPGRCPLCLECFSLRFCVASSLFIHSLHVSECHLRSNAFSDCLLFKNDPYLLPYPRSFFWLFFRVEMTRLSLMKLFYA